MNDARRGEVRENIRKLKLIWLDLQDIAKQEQVARAKALQAFGENSPLVERSGPSDYLYDASRRVYEAMEYLNEAIS